MNDESKLNNRGLINYTNNSLEVRKSGLIKRGLDLILRLQKRKVRILICPVYCAGENVHSKFIKNAFINKYTIEIIISYYGEEILNYADKQTIDLFILVLNNVKFRSAQPSQTTQDRLDKALEIVSQIKIKYQKPVIVLSGLIDDPKYSSQIARAEQVADFFYPLPSNLDVLKKAIENCLDPNVKSDVPSLT